MGPSVRLLVLAAVSAGLLVVATGCELFYPLGGYTGGDAGHACDGGYCACLVPKPTFCDDFDEGSLGALWDGTPSCATGSSLAADSDASRSPPSSLLVSFPFVGATGAECYLATNLDGPFAEARLEFDLLAPDGFTNDQIAAFQLASGYSIGLAISADQVSSFEEPSGSNGSDVVLGLAVPATATWSHVTIIVHPSDPEAGAGFFQLSYGNPDAGAAVDEHAIRTGEGQTTQPQLQLGGVYVYDSPAGWRANFDNVVLYLH